MESVKHKENNSYHFIGGPFDGDTETIHHFYIQSDKDTEWVDYHITAKMPSVTNSEDDEYLTTDAHRYCRVKEPDSPFIYHGVVKIDNSQAWPPNEQLTGLFHDLALAIDSDDQERAVKIRRELGNMGIPGFLL